MQNDAPTQPFADAESAWFWFVRCQKIRREGARLEKDASPLARPCDPDDIYKAAVGLQSSGKIGAQHLRALANYGLAERPPDRRDRDETLAARLWSEAMDRLTTVLRQKKIIE